MNQVMETKLQENPMRRIRIEKVLLSAGATGPDLEKAKKLLSLISGMKPQVLTSNKRIPDFNVKGETGVEFTADKAGEFDFYCTVFCGDKHQEMKGKLIIK